jgi:hypothetical protein
MAINHYAKAHALAVGESMEWHSAPMCNTMISEWLNERGHKFDVSYEITNWEASQGYTLITRIAL